MTSKRPVAKLAPPGLTIDQQEIGPDGFMVLAHGGDPFSVCPLCGVASSSVHSRYDRRLLDLPAYGRRLTIRLSARRFRCRTAGCARKIFTERFISGSVVMYARRSARLDDLLHIIAVALGGRPGERLAQRLSTPVSADTLIRLLRRRAAPTPTTVRVVGIDDFAWQRGQRYGTIICDLEKRRVIDLLPDREGATVAAWLKQRPDIEVVCRDRGVGFKEGATVGAPQASQVADRWHLLENATAAFLEIVRRHMGAIRQAVAHDDVDPETLSCAQMRQWSGFERRKEVNRAIAERHRRGESIKAIVRTSGLSRKTVRRILRGTRDDIFRSRESSLDRWAHRLDAEWSGGCRKGAELWRRLKAAGFNGSQRVVTEWTTRKRRAVSSPAPASGGRIAVPSSRIVARTILDRFKTMVASGTSGDLDLRLADAARTELAPSRTALHLTKLRYRPPSPDLGLTGRQKVRSPGSSLSNARCSDAPKSICSEPALWWRHK